MISPFASNGTTKIPYNFVGRSDNWEVNLPSTSDRVSLQYTGIRFPIYEVVFKDMWFTLSFSDFQISVL